MFGFVYVSFLCVVTVVLIYSNNCDIWILLTNNNCEGLFGSFTPSVKAKGEGGGGELLWYWNWRYHTKHCKSHDKSLKHKRLRKDIVV